MGDKKRTLRGTSALARLAGLFIISVAAIGLSAWGGHDGAKAKPPAAATAKKEAGLLKDINLQVVNLSDRPVMLSLCNDNRYDADKCKTDQTLAPNGGEDFTIG